jgi:urease accessory protein UreH
MFIVDDIIKNAIGYIKDIVLHGRKGHDEAVKHGRIALREIAKSIEEIRLQLEAGLHKLQRVTRDPVAFRRQLSDLVDESSLLDACNESGVCKDLRIAEDELRSLAALNQSGDSRAILSLAQTISAYEADFVRSVRQFLSHARDLDLIVAASAEAIEPKVAIRALEERVKALRSIEAEIQNALTEFRAHRLGAHASQ